MGEILLISADWRLRALARAQLLEAGFQVRALASVEDALLELIRDEAQVALIVLDVEGASLEARRLSDLWKLGGEAPVLLCGGVWSQSGLADLGLPSAGVLLRPFRIGDLVDRVQRMLACQEGAATSSC